MPSQKNSVEPLGARRNSADRRSQPGFGTETERADPTDGETGAVPAISITESALEMLRQLELPDGGFLRIRVIPGGCSGWTYSAEVDDELFITDLILYESGRLRIVSDPESAESLEGLEIDYSDDLIRSGFRFTNPNASGTCGCGASFGA